MFRFWEAVQTATKTTMMVVFWKGRCIAHLGYKAPGISSSSICMGELCNDSITRNVPRSLGNLALFPGRSEFLEYLPNNTQSLFVQPLHPDGVIVFGSATQRGFTILDQVWFDAEYRCIVMFRCRQKYHCLLRHVSTMYIYINKYTCRLGFLHGVISSSLH